VFFAMAWLSVLNYFLGKATARRELMQELGLLEQEQGQTPKPRAADSDFAAGSVAGGGDGGGAGSSRPVNPEPPVDGYQQPAPAVSPHELQLKPVKKQGSKSHKVNPSPR
jgi:hypothetical protein